MKINCPECKSNKIIMRGFRYNKLSKKQKYQCTDCEHWFVEDDGFKRMRHKPAVIVRAIHMHNDGMSLFNVKNHLWQYDKVNISREAIRLWGNKYGIFLKSTKEKSKTKIKRKTAFR